MRVRAASLLLAWLGGTGMAVGAETWLEVKSPNFTVVSNAGEGTASKSAAEFEQVRAAYAKLWPGTHVAESRPMVVLALRDETTLKRWAPGWFVKGGIDVASGSAGGPDREYLLLRTDSRPDDRNVTPNYNLYRAYLTLLLSGNFERRLPLWLSNGLAAVLGNVSVRETDILVGKPVPWEFQQFNERSRMPLRTILDARSDSPLVQQESERRVFDAQCYVLVHYLLFGNHSANSARLAQFQQLWLAGRSQDQALAEAFGDLAALEKALSVYAASPVLSYAQLKAEARVAGDKPATRVIPPAEVAGLQACVHVAMNRPVEAQASIRESRTIDPRSPVSYDAEGLLADRDQDKTRATQAYLQAVEFGSTLAYSYYRAAQLAWKPVADAATLAAQRQRLERAIELSPSYAGAYSLLAEVLVEQGDGPAALEKAQRAVALEPGRSYHRLELSRALNQVGRTDEARKSADLALKLAENDAERSDIQRFVLFLDESSRYAQSREQRETLQKQAACEGGDNAACAQILPVLERSCGQGDAKACLYLGWLYGGYGGLAKDALKAAGYVGKACDAGDKDACVEHAEALARGQGVAKDEAKAMAALGALCEGGYLQACTRLAVIHAAKPTSASRARAKSLLTRACEGGQQDACSMAKEVR
jgi:TPR repeat protein